jgi:hypothetical protein
MRIPVLLLTVGALVAGLLVPATPAQAVPVFEDPQICLNGNLLMVEPTTQPIEVWVSAGSQVVADFNIVNCGGNPSLPVLHADNLLNVGIGKWVTIAVKTKRHTDVVFHWDGEDFVKNSGKNKWIVFVKYAD